MSGRHQLAPNAKCSVCNDDASGFHYGVNSCEGCKGFFRRCITQGINFRCSNEEKCQITPFTRNSCQYCRLKRCFQVGMSREASRLGRRPKKTLKPGGFSSKDFDRQISDGSGGIPSQTPDSDPSQLNWDYTSIARATISDMMGCTPEMMQKLASMMPSMITAGGNMPHPFDMSNQLTQFDMTNRMRSDSPMNSDLCALGDGAKLTADAGSVTHMELNEWRNKQFKVMSRYMHTNKETSSEQGIELSSNEMLDSRQEEIASKASSPNSSSTAVSPLSAASSSLSSVGTQQSNPLILAVSDVQKEKLARFISYTSVSVSDTANSLREEVEKAIINSHTTHCYHLRPRINAAIAELEAREQRGEDIRPPTGFWAHWMSELLPTIERVVRFLKHIPGFRELPLNDQILLIKKGAFSIVLCQAMPMVDHENLTLIDPQLKYRNHRKDMEEMPLQFLKLFDDHFILASKFKEVDITDYETALLNAVIAVNCEIDGLENPVAIKKLEQLFIQTLHKYITDNFPGSSFFYDSPDYELVPVDTCEHL